MGDMYGKRDEPLGHRHHPSSLGVGHRCGSVLGRAFQAKELPKPGAHEALGGVRVLALGARADGGPAQPRHSPRCPQGLHRSSPLSD